MAILIRHTAALRLALIFAAVVALSPAAGALAAGGEPAATTPPPNCAERFPAEGPAGVDLRLGCIVGELVGAYSVGQATPPAPLSTYAIVLAVAVVAGLAALWLSGRLLARRAAARLAPVLPEEWWICDRCRSVNGRAMRRCYGCGGPRSPGPTLATDEQPSTPQSFGRGKRE